MGVDEVGVGEARRMKQGKIAFKTKDGKAVSFKSTGVKQVKAVARVKQLEKRLSAMEKAVLSYNAAVEKRKKEKSDSDASGVGAGKVGRGGGVGGGVRKGKSEGPKAAGSSSGVKGRGGNGGKLVGDAGVKKV
jgi:hypothetical protein